jgi:hypothetical protein
MEQIAVILLVLTIISAVLKTSFFRKTRYMAIFAVVCSSVVFACYPVAIEQNKMILVNVLTNRETLLDIALLLTVESLIFIGADVLSLRQRHDETIARNPRIFQIVRCLGYFPGIFFFGSLFYFEVQVFLMGWHIGFVTLAVGIAACVCVILLTGCRLAKKALPEEDLRLEISYFLHLAQIMLASVIAAGASGDARFHSSPADWPAVAGVAAIAAAGCGTGYLRYKRKQIHNS